MPLQQFDYLIHDVAFSHDSRYAALAAGDAGDGLTDCEQGEFALWDLTSRAQIVQYGPSEEAYTTGVLFSPTGDRVFAWGGVRDGDFDYGPARGYIGIWDAQRGHQIFLEHGRDRSVSCLTVAGDGALFAFGLNDGQIGVGDCTTQEIQLLTGHLGPVRSVAFAPAGALLASSSEDGAIRILDLKAAGCDPGRLEGQHSPLEHVLLTRDGSRAITICTHHSAWLWSTRTGEVVAKPRPSGVNVLMGPSPTFYFDGETLLMDGPSLVDTADGKTTWSRHDDWSRGPTAFAAGHHRKIVAMLVEGWKEVTGQIMSMEGATPVVRLRVPKRRRYKAELFFSPDDRWLAIQDEKKGITIYDAATGGRARSFADRSPYHFTSDGRHLLGAGSEPLRLWDMETGLEVARQPIAKHWAHEAVSADGRFRATVARKRVAVLDLAGDRKPIRLKGHDHPSDTEFAFTEDSRFLLTRDAGWKIDLWDLETGERAPSECVKREPDDNRIDRTLSVRHPINGSEILHIRHGWVNKAAFDPGCQRVFFTTCDGLTCMWDIAAGTCEVIAERDLPVGALASGDRYYAVADAQETAIVDSITNQEIAWFPMPFPSNGTNFASHSGPRLWAGGIDNRFYMFSLEGGGDEQRTS